MINNLLDCLAGCLTPQLTSGNSSGTGLQKLLAMGGAAKRRNRTLSFSAKPSVTGGPGSGRGRLAGGFLPACYHTTTPDARQNRRVRGRSYTCLL